MLYRFNHKKRYLYVHNFWLNPNDSLLFRKGKLLHRDTSPFSSLWVLIWEQTSKWASCWSFWLGAVSEMVLEPMQWASSCWIPPYPVTGAMRTLPLYSRETFSCLLYPLGSPLDSVFLFLSLLPISCVLLWHSISLQSSKLFGLRVLSEQL